MNITELTDQNPWWKDKKLIEDDPLIVIWEKSSFKWRPGIIETFQWDVNIIYSLRGPRQVGKTTLLKLKIRDLLQDKIDPRRIFYLTCDLVDSHEKLTSIITEYLKWARRFSGDRLFLFLDEVSAVKDWQRSIKYLYDIGKLKNCVVILAGSHSIDLMKATETLAGRRGDVDKFKGVPDKVFPGAKFSEYVETRNKPISHVIQDLDLLSAQNKSQLLHELMNGKINDSIFSFTPYISDLQGLLDDYLITGGIPRSIDSYISHGAIPEIVYSDYVNLITRDVIRWGGKEMFLRQILKRITETLSSRISWNSLKDGTEISTHDTAHWYVDLLSSSYVTSYIYHLNQDRGEPFYRKAKKIYFSDPFIFHSLRWWTMGMGMGMSRKSPFDDSVEYLKNPENKSKVIESVLCDHLIRLLSTLNSLKFDYSTNLFYWVSRKGREVDFVAKVGKNNRFLPVELKYQPTIRREDVYGLLDFMKGGKSGYGVIVTRDELSEDRDHVRIPAALFLLLA